MSLSFLLTCNRVSTLGQFRPWSRKSTCKLAGHNRYYSTNPSFKISKSFQARTTRPFKFQSVRVGYLFSSKISFGEDSVRVPDYYTKNQAKEFSTMSSVSSSTGATSAESGPDTIIALIQMTSTGNKAANMECCNRLIASAKEKGAKIVFLPECFDYVPKDKVESSELSETIDGQVISNYRKQAKDFGIWISLGGFHERQTELRQDGLSYLTNCHVLIDNTGSIMSKYNKIHLFDLDHPVNNVFLRESEAVLPGSEVVPPVFTPIGFLGLGICYDMRFPEFALKLRLLGASALTYPSAFTVPTGEAHWESILRARAIETQCYVIAAAQVGRHNEKRESYGHSMVIDPWGKVIAEAKAEEELLVVRIDINLVDEIRSKMPVVKHRRPNVYQLEQHISFSIPTDEQASEIVPFGHIPLKLKFIFLETEHSRAFVNRKCVLPGHVLVIPKVPTFRLFDLSPVQTNDFFRLVQAVQSIIEEIYGASSSTVAIQDGPDAGQSVKHLHAHIIPRKAMDLPGNDEIYEKLASHDKGDVQWRKEDEMEEEANQIRGYIYAGSSSSIRIVPPFNIKNK